MAGSQLDAARGEAPVFTRGWLVPALILLIAAATRWWAIGSQCFWIDEIFTLQTSAGNGLAHEHIQPGTWLEAAPAPTDLGRGEGPRGIVRWAHEDTQAPLYFMIVNFWRWALGSGEVAVRSLSAICSLAGVAAVYLLCRSLCSTDSSAAGWVAALSALLMALAPAQVVFAQEARPYAMALLLVLLAALALARVERAGFTRLRGAWLVLALVALMLTHYTGAAPAAAMCAYAAIRLRGRARWGTLGAFAVAASCFVILWGPILMRQVNQPADRLSFLDEPAEGHFARTLDRAIRQPAAMVVAVPLTQNTPAPILWMARLVGAVLMVVPLLAMWRRPSLLLPWMLMIAPIALSMASDLKSTRAALELPRFTFLGSAGAIMLVANLILLLPQRARAPAASGAIAIIALALLAPWLIGLPSAYDREKPDIRPMAAFSGERVQNGAALVIVQPAGREWQGGALYATLSHYAGAWPGPVIALDSPPQAEALARLSAAPEVWMLSPTPRLPADILADLFAPEQISIRNMGVLGRIGFRPAGSQ